MYCVILGDMINSREMRPGERDIAGAVTRRAFDQINAEYRTYLLSGFEMASGDSFEAVLLARYKAPGIIRRLIKELYSVSRLRISVGLGDLYTLGDDNQRVNTMDGPAFHIAADAMAVLKKNAGGHWLQLSIQTARDAQPLVQSTISLLTALTARWTDRQRKAVWDMERIGGSINELAMNWGVTPNAVRKHLKAADYEVYRAAWNALREYLANMDINRTAAPEKALDYTDYYNIACRDMDAGDPVSAEKSASGALEAACRKFGENDEKLAPVLNKLGEALLAARRYREAADVLERSLSVQRGLPPGRDNGLLALALLGEAQYRMGLLNEAQATLSKGKAIETALRGETPSIGYGWDDIMNGIR